jgi:hypothetical protein
VCISVHLPEMEMHTRGADCEDHELETVRGCKFGIISRNTQQDVGVHTHATWIGRSTEAENINDSIIKGIWNIHAPGGAAMRRYSLPRTLQERQ